MTGSGCANDHLGGWVPGGDPATWFPHLWTWLVETQGVNSVLDIGCGDGQALGYFEQLGCNVVGIEGTPQDNRRIIQHDYATGPLRFNEMFDLCWCCEFVEHVEERHVPNFVETFKCCQLLLMTHAFPGQPGHHHVNCRTPEYWIAVLRTAGLQVDWKMTKKTKQLATRNEFTWEDADGVHGNHYLRSGLAFVHV